MKDPFELYIDSESKLTLHGLKQYYVKLEEKQKILDKTCNFDRTPPNFLMKQIIMIEK
jgi:hypothetical protein